MRADDCPAQSQLMGLTQGRWKKRTACVSQLRDKMVCERGLALGRYMYMRSIAIWMPPSGELDGHEETIRRANTSSGRIGTNVHVAIVVSPRQEAQAVLGNIYPWINSVLVNACSDLPHMQADSNRKAICGWTRFQLWLPRRIGAMAAL